MVAVGAMAAGVISVFLVVVFVALMPGVFVVASVVAAVTGGG
jgi:hypothetical protein